MAPRHEELGLTYKVGWMQGRSVAGFTPVFRELMRMGADPIEAERSLIEVLNGQ